MKIFAVQNSRKKSIADSISEVNAIIAGHCPKNVDFIVLPEHFLCLPDEKQFSVNEAKEVMAWLCQLARDCHAYVVTGSWVEKHGGKAFNVLRMIDRNGVMIAEVFKDLSGQESIQARDFPVIETDKGKVGIMLGDDFWQLETSRIQSLQGAEIILVSGTFGQNNYEQKRSAIWGLASLNCTLVAFTSVCNEFTPLGSSIIALPNQILATADKMDVSVSAEIPDSTLTDLREADLTFKNTLWFGLWSRRVELYQPLTQTGHKEVMDGV